LVHSMVSTRIFFVTDLHGSDICFRKFLNAGSFYKADVLIMAGDMTGKLVVPVVEQPNGTFKAWYLGADKIVKANEVEKLEQAIRDVGFYPYMTKEEKVDQAQSEKLFMEEVTARVRNWLDLADKVLKGTKTRLFVSPGNDDVFDIDPLLEFSTDKVNPEGPTEQRPVHVDNNHEMISLGWTNPTPWATSRECSEEELAKKIDALISKVSNMEQCIFNFHCPPLNSGLDDAPKIDKDLRTRPETVGVGSKAVLEAVVTHKPLLGLHGHIHESRGTMKVGPRTLCFNPGSEYSEGILRGAIINIDEKGVKGFLLTSG